MRRRGTPMAESVLSDEERDTLQRWARRPRQRRPGRGLAGPDLPRSWAQTGHYQGRYDLRAGPPR